MPQNQKTDEKPTENPASIGDVVGAAQEASTQNDIETALRKVSEGDVTEGDVAALRDALHVSGQAGSLATHDLWLQSDEGKAFLDSADKRNAQAEKEAKQAADQAEHNAKVHERYQQAIEQARTDAVKRDKAVQRENEKNDKNNS